MAAETTYRARQDLILREIAGENILIPVGEIAMKLHGMISLTESGLLLWRELEDWRSEAELTARLLTEYEIDRETAAADTADFLHKMLELGILETSGEVPQ